MRGFWILAIAALYCLRLAGADEGSPWQLREIPNQAPLNRIFFLNDRVGWMQTGLNGLLKTSDGGVTWAPLKTNLTERRTDLAGIWFRDENRGWAAGAIRQQPTIWETNDGGSSWTEKFMEARAFEGSNGAMLDIRFVDPLHGWAVGYNGLKGTIKVTYDAGEHWTTQYTGGEITNQFNRIRFWDAVHGWVLGFDSVMYTDNGGESWELQHFGVGSNLSDIDLVGPSDAWIAGDWGHLLHLKDRRDSAEVPLTGSVGDSFIAWIRFASKDVGWAWGVHGEIVVTRDGGKTWVRDDIPLKLNPDTEFMGDGAMAGSNLFITVSPGRLLVRPIR